MAIDASKVLRTFEASIAITNLLQAVVLLPLLLVHSKDVIWIVYISAFMDACVSQFFTPAVNAIIPNLVDKEQLLPANALNSLSYEPAKTATRDRVSYVERSF